MILAIFPTALLLSVNRPVSNLHKYVCRNPFDIICLRGCSHRFHLLTPPPTRNRIPPRMRIREGPLQNPANAGARAARLFEINLREDGGKSWAARATVTRYPNGNVRRRGRSDETSTFFGEDHIYP